MPFKAAGGQNAHGIYLQSVALRKLPPMFDQLERSKNNTDQ